MPKKLVIPSDLAFDVIEEIAKAKGKAKLGLIRPSLSMYFKAAYDPYIKYHIKLKETAVIFGIGEQEFNYETWNLLDDLAQRRLTGFAAIQRVTEHISKLTSKSKRLFVRIINKDLRMGASAKTINKVLPNCIPTHDIMLAKPFEESRVKFPCYISPKIDGVRAVYKNSKFYSRNGHVYKGLDHLEDYLKGFATVLDGELIVPGKTFQVSSGMIRSDNLTPTAQYYVFDLPENNTSFASRLDIIKQYFSNKVSSDIHPLYHKVVTRMKHITKFYKMCRDRGFEGAVVKPIDYQYKGTRSYDWMKMKEVETIDVKVVGMFKGEGKYSRQLGGLIIKLDSGKEVKVGSGFSDEERIDFWLDPELTFGKMIEVMYTELTDQGSLRHPRFICLRPDKD